MGMCKGVWAYVETTKDVQVGLMPFYHIFGTFKVSMALDDRVAKLFSGLVMHLNYPFMSGQPCVLMLRGFDAEGLCRNIERFGVTTIMLAPPIILTLSLHPGACSHDMYEYDQWSIHVDCSVPGLDKYNMSSLRCIASAAAPLSLVVAERLLERLAKRGADVKLLQGTIASRSGLFLADLELLIHLSWE